jgi:hypothetical protein
MQSLMLVVLKLTVILGTGENGSLVVKLFKCIVPMVLNLRVLLPERGMSSHGPEFDSSTRFDVSGVKSSDYFTRVNLLLHEFQM